MSQAYRDFVYFIRPIGMDGPVKIGCSYRPEGRLAAMAPRHPYPLEIAATIAGDQKVEGRFHEMFADQHVGREWFAGSDKLTALIEAVRSGAFTLADLPEEPSSIRRTQALDMWARRRAAAQDPAKP